jgi:ATP-dependent exoDNAse (exonuclease V) beta subunit
VLVKAAGSKTDLLGDAFVVERNKAIIDELNVLYVGLTRPVDRLHWLLISGKRNSNPVHKWIDESLTKLNSEWGETPSIEFGQKVKRVGEKKAKIEDGQTGMSCSPLHLNKLMKLEELTTAEDRTEAASIGIAVHDILSGIGNIEQVDLDDFLILKLRKVDDEIKSDVEGHIRRVMEDKQLRSWFECESFRERDLIDGKSKIQRPDRICVLKDGLAVVDFKTGIVKEEHKVQVEDYVQLLTQIEEKSVKGYLMYTDSLELVEV